MKLLAKFNLILLVLFGTCASIVCYFAHDFLIQNAREQALQQAQLMLASAKSVRDYTSTDLSPLIKQNPKNKIRFLPESVPAFGANSTFSRLRKQYPDYSYREATLNPTNPQDRAVDWETDVIRYFRDHPGQAQFSGERDTPTGRSLFVAAPLIAKPPCLECHSVPSAAPKSMIAVYGKSNGFGWKLDDVIAAQVVSVPMSVPMQVAQKAFERLLIFLLSTMALTMLALDAGVYLLVIRPLMRVSENADRVSKGETELPELPVTTRDEIGSVTSSFNRMQVSLSKALRMLGE
jgi:HAMP domain-containing protein